MLVFQNMQLSDPRRRIHRRAIVMIVTVIFIIFYHDSKHEEIDRWVDFSFSGNSLRQAFGYYRFMAVSMLFFYVLFTCSCLLLQGDGFKIFSDGKQPVLRRADFGCAVLTGPCLSGRLFRRHGALRSAARQPLHQQGLGMVLDLLVRVPHFLRPDADQDPDLVRLDLRQDPDCPPSPYADRTRQMRLFD